MESLFPFSRMLQRIVQLSVTLFASSVFAEELTLEDTVDKVEVYYHKRFSGELSKRIAMKKLEALALNEALSEQERINAIKEKYPEAFLGAKERAEKIKSAALAGDAEAQYEYGRQQAMGENLVEAMKWFQKAAEQGYAKAQYWLGFFYGNGLGIRKNEKEAMKWYRKAAEQGYVRAGEALESLYRHSVQNFSMFAMWSALVREEYKNKARFYKIRQSIGMGNNFLEGDIILP